MSDETPKAPILPRGFCPECLISLEEGDFHGVHVRLARGIRIAGGYCPHHQVAAVRTEMSDQEVGPWRLLCPATEEDLLAMMRGAAALPEPIIPEPLGGVVH